MATRPRLALVLASIALTAALAGVLALLAHGPEKGPRDGGQGQRGDGLAGAGGPRKAAQGLPGGPVAVDDGPGAPRPDPALDGPPAADPSAIRPEARERLQGEMRALVREADAALERQDWERLRETTRGLRGDPKLMAGLAAAEARRPREALVTGLLFEELIEDGALDAAARDDLGRTLVPLLRAGLSGVFEGDLRDDALRLLSRFPSSEAEEALLRVLEDPASTPEARRQALFSLGETATPRAVPAIRVAALDPRDPETARVAALAFHRTALRLRDADMARETAQVLRPRLAALLAPAVQAGDGDAFSRLSTTLAELAGASVSAFLSTELLDARDAPPAVRQAALEALMALRALDALPALKARRGRLGDADLDALLEEVVRSLEAFAPG